MRFLCVLQAHFREEKGAFCPLSEKTVSVFGWGASEGLLKLDGERAISSSGIFCFSHDSAGLADARWYHFLNR
jgi:hypothetical protein